MKFILHKISHYNALVVTLYLSLIYLFLRSTTFGPQTGLSVQEFTDTSKLHWFYFKTLRPVCNLWPLT